MVDRDTFISQFEQQLSRLACDAAMSADQASMTATVTAGLDRLAALAAGQQAPGFEAIRAALADASAPADARLAALQREWDRWRASSLAGGDVDVTLAADASAPAEVAAPVEAAAATASPSEAGAGDGDTSDPQIDQDVESLRADPEMAAMFFAEANDHLGLVEAGVLELEARPSDTKLLNDIFRSYHTIKGNSGVVGVKSIQEFAHRVENLLDNGRSGKLTIGPEAIDVILKSIDILNAMLADLTKRLAGEPGQVFKAQRLAVMATVDRLLSAPAGEPAPVAAAPAAAPVVTVPVASAPVAAPAPAPPVAAPVAAAVPPPSAPAAPAVSPARAQVVDAPAPAPVSPAVAAAPSPAPAAAPSPVAAQPVAKPAVSPAKDEGAPPHPQRRADDAMAQTSVKVDTRKLDNLVDTVGELVIVQSIINEDASLVKLANERLARHMAQLARITTELQRNAMSMRMVPIRQTFQKMARLVRDLSRMAGKNVELVMSGEDTELDRKVVEDINDPLMHMIRNSVDHGIESNEQRQELGKSLPAQLKLSAFHQGGNIVIVLADDGRGLNSDKILAKAIAQGIVAPGQQLSPGEVHQLIFKPGFSTADKVTEISGRGVGMDVVRRNIEALRGRVEIQTELGKGTSFSIKLPLTLAIVEGLVLRVGEERYVLPTFAVRESLRPTPAQLQLVQGEARLIQVRGSLLPLARLADLLGVSGMANDPTEGTVVVVEDDGRPLALVVDELLGKQEVVIKSLGDVFHNVRGIAGGAILGDGRVGLILDAGGVASLLAHSVPAA
ncbi:MAG: chemotaxis protein CheA [Vicinamibacterales bacterium]